MKAIYTDGRDPTQAVGQAARRPVTAVMTSPVRCVNRAVPLDEALRTMVRHALRHLAVVDEDGRCLGVLADRAIAAAWASDPGCLPLRSVATELDPVPAIVGTGAHVLEVARMMRATGTDAVAVVDPAGAVAGIVTGSDLIGLLAR